MMRGTESDQTIWVFFSSSVYNQVSDSQMTHSRMNHSFESILLIESVKRANKQTNKQTARFSIGVDSMGHFRTRKGKE